MMEEQPTLNEILDILGGTFTVLEIKACLFCEEGCSAKKFRFMIFNLGFEL